jgi:hypothetical protein
MTKEDEIERAWDKVASEFGVGALDEKIRKELEESLPPLIRSDTAFVSDYLQDLYARLEWVTMANKIRRTTGKVSIEESKPQKKGKRFERRVYIASFVLFRIHTPESLFIPLFTGKPIPKFRIDWKAMFNEWNQEHPSDTMSSPTVFRTTFYRILRESEVLQEILKRELAEEKILKQVVYSADKALKVLEVQLPRDYLFPPKSRLMWEMLQMMVKETYNEKP